MDNPASETVSLTPEQRENMKKWILALESDQYAQCTDGLRKVDEEGATEGYCCLGVACDVYDPKGWKPNPNGDFCPFGDGQHDLVMPVGVALWLGLQAPAGELDDNGLDPRIWGVTKKESQHPDHARWGPNNEPILQPEGTRIYARASWWNDTQECTFREIAAMLREQFGILEDAP